MIGVPRPGTPAGGVDGDGRGTEVRPASAYGHFHVLADRAHALYVDGRGDQALRACAEALPLVEAAGDTETARSLRFITCAVHERGGQWSLLRQASEDLLDRMGLEAGPYWRAKALGLLGDALIQQGRSAAALDHLAEAYGLIMDHPGSAFDRGSACQTVGKPLYSALLFGPTVELVRTAKRIVGFPTVAFTLTAITEASVLGTWGLFHELLGRRSEADAQYAACASAAVLAGGLTRIHGLEVLHLEASALLQFAYQRLDCGPVDRSLLQRHADNARCHVALPGLALASVRARSGEIAGARSQLEAVRAAADRQGESVVGWAATAWLAELEEAEHGRTGATLRWRALALDMLERLWLDRAGRFEHLVARHRVAELSAKVFSDTSRLWEDPLTGVGNRRLLDELLADPDTAHRAVAFVDVDRFKTVNDDHGHDVGDAVLRRVAVTVRGSCRTGDTVVRYGGDEFVVLLAEGGDVEVLGRRIRTAVARTDWQDVAPGLQVSVTVGTALAGSGALERADAHLLALRAVPAQG